MQENAKYLIEFNKKYKTNILKTDDTYTSLQNGKQICFNSGGCELSKRGYCIMCNYGCGRKKLSLEQVKIALDDMFKDCSYEQPINYKVFGCNGSILDTNEFSEDCFDYLLDYIAKYNIDTVCFETFYSTVTEEKLAKIKKKLIKIKVDIELGFESANNFIRENCYLKFIDNEIFKEKIALIHKYGMNCVVNLMYGAPFCMLKEQNADITNSIKWCFENNVDFICIFPMIIKNNTLLAKIYDLGFAKPAYLYGLIDILTKIPNDKLNRVNFLWFSDYESSSRYIKAVPYTCEKCNGKIVDFLKKFGKSNLAERIKLKQTLPLKIDCACTKQYNNELASENCTTKEQRINECVLKLKKEIYK